MNGLEKRIENLVSRIIDESKDLVDDMVDDMYCDESDGIEDICFQLYGLIEEIVYDELDDGEDVSDEVESDTCRAVDTAIEKNGEKIDSMVRCAIKEKQGSKP